MNFDLKSGKTIFFKWKNEGNWPVEFVSQNIVQILGYEVSEFLDGSLTYLDLIHPNDIDKATQEIRYASTHDKEEFTHEIYRVKDKSGKYHFVYDHTAIIRDQHGTITHYHGYISDETNYYEEQQRLDLVLEGTGLGLWDWNLSTSYVEYDERWANQLGYKRSEIEYTVEFWESKVHPDDIQQVYEDANSHIKGETEFYSNIHRMMHKSGHWMYILTRGKVVEWDLDGRAVRLSGTHIDITEFKEAELSLERKRSQLERVNDALLQVQKDLSDASYRLDFATKAGGVGIWTWDISTNEYIWNSVMYELYDLPNNIPTTHETWKNAIHPEDVDETESLKNDAVEGKAEYKTTYRVILQDGTIRHIKGAAKVERDASGKATRMIGTNMEIVS